MRALARLAKAGSDAVLVAAIEQGVNTDEVGAIVEFGLADFVPVPCCFPTCQVNSYVFVDGPSV